MFCCYNVLMTSPRSTLTFCIKKTLHQCCFNIDQPFSTSAQHQNNICQRLIFNTKDMYNICTTSSQRHLRWSNIAKSYQMLTVCWNISIEFIEIKWYNPSQKNLMSFDFSYSVVQSQKAVYYYF